MEKIALRGKRGEGLFAIVDKEDFEVYKNYKWHVSSNGYVSTSIYYADTKKTLILKLHRLIMGYPEELTVDHINRNKLDNRRSNLRTCTVAENNRNKTKQKHSSNKYKGVKFQKNGGKFRAEVKVNGKRLHLGMFEDEKEAAIAYNEAAFIYYGEFANLNRVIL